MQVTPGNEGKKTGANMRELFTIQVISLNVFVMFLLYSGAGEQCQCVAKPKCTLGTICTVL